MNLGAFPRVVLAPSDNHVSDEFSLQRQSWFLWSFLIDLPSLPGATMVRARGCLEICSFLPASPLQLFVTGEVESFPKTRDIKMLGKPQVTLKTGPRLLVSRDDGNHNYDHCLLKARCRLFTVIISFNPHHLLT